MSQAITQLPSDHTARVERMKLSLAGLQLGDALGEWLSHEPPSAPQRILDNRLPAGPWMHTDDTEMAISIVQVLQRLGRLDQDAVAAGFVRRFEREPNRGYGRMTWIQMQKILAGARWQDTSAEAFNGQGSMGNGSAMRVAPLGAYYAEDLGNCVEAARASSVVTHTHPEGVAGAIAIAVGAAMAWQLRLEKTDDRPHRFFDAVLNLTPDSAVRRGIEKASELPVDSALPGVALDLGCGARVTAPDTVPFCIWMTAHHMDDFGKALGRTVSVGGDCDTNAAIVCGMVALSVGRDGIPEGWLDKREKIIPEVGN